MYSKESATTVSVGRGAEASWDTEQRKEPGHRDTYASEIHKIQQHHVIQFDALRFRILLQPDRSTENDQFGVGREAQHRARHRLPQGVGAAPNTGPEHEGYEHGPTP